ncbi:hypothetical protein BYT27DRAFT_6387785 [Phlegmacium glaucopus]|nr:hypothetical protein BYT27DRAFT_6387785 [Phlegmacium glaucopus]
MATRTIPINQPTLPLAMSLSMWFVSLDMTKSYPGVTSTMKNALHGKIMAWMNLTLLMNLISTVCSYACFHHHSVYHLGEKRGQNQYVKLPPCKIRSKCWFVNFYTAVPNIFVITNLLNKKRSVRGDLKA